MAAQYEKSGIGTWIGQLCVVLGCFLGVAGYCYYQSPEGVVVNKITPQRNYPPERLAAWDKITPRFVDADNTGRQAAERVSTRVESFFDERKQRARAFADEVLGLEGKWEFLKSKLPWGDEDGHRKYLRDRFSEKVISSQELQELIQSVVAEYVTELQGIENDLLVKVRADLSDSALGGLEANTALRTEEAFRQEYAKALEQVASIVTRDLGVQVSREVVSWIASDIATNITISLASGLAERLGITGGILSTGAASGVMSLGIGIAAGFLIDALLDQFLSAMGHDPAGEIAANVATALDRFRALLLDGEAEASQVYQRIRQMQQADVDASVREECRQAGNRMDRGGHLGLKNELRRLRDERASLREQALKNLILEGSEL